MGGVSKRTKEKVKDRRTFFLLQLEYILTTFSAEDILMGKIE